LDQESRRTGVLAPLFVGPLLLLGYAVAALLTVAPIYLLVAVVGSSYMLLPNTRHEFELIAILFGSLTTWFFVSGIARARA
jgi:hypothetical protein